VGIEMWSDFLESPCDVTNISSSSTYLEICLSDKLRVTRRLDETTAMVAS